MAAQALRAKVTYLCRVDAFREAIDGIKRVHSIETRFFGMDNARTIEANETMHIIVRNAVAIAQNQRHAGVTLNKQSKRQAKKSTMPH